MSTVPTIKLSTAAIARALIRARGLAPDVAQRVAEKLAVRLASARTTEPPAALPDAGTPSATESPALTLSQAMQVLRQRHPGVDDTVLAPRAERIAGLSAAKAALADAPPAPVSDGVVAGSARKLVLALVRAGHSYEKAMILAAASKELSDGEGDEVEAADGLSLDEEVEAFAKKHGLPKALARRCVIARRGASK